LQDPGVDGMIKLRRVSEKQEVK